MYTTLDIDSRKKLFCFILLDYILLYLLLYGKLKLYNVISKMATKLHIINLLHISPRVYTTMDVDSEKTCFVL